MTAIYYDWPAAAGNIQKARKSWGWMSWILIREGADPKVLGHFFKAGLQAVLLVWAEMWVLTPMTEKALRSFKHRVARWLTGRTSGRRGGGCWDYPLLTAAMTEAGFEEIRTCVTRR